MNIYLVGGAVRDRLLGLEIKDRDWLVVGSSPQEMKEAGFQQVGRDFPVFIHPKTGEEYALARTERKTGRGHQGFAFTYDRSVSAKEDLSRRDLTINAIAEDENGQLIDPFNGVQDIERRILRHLSPAFAEDPLRVLRLMRFWARFAELGFTIAPETLTLCHKMVDSGELNELTPERVWQECEKALMTNNPEKFFQGLKQVGAFPVFGFSPATNILKEMNDRLILATARCSDPAARLALWLSGENNAQYRTLFCQKLPLPKHYQYWLKLTVNHGNTVFNWQKSCPKDRWLALKASNSLRKTGDILMLAQLMGADESLINTIKYAQHAIEHIKAQHFPNIQGADLGEAIKNAQISALTNHASFSTYNL